MKELRNKSANLHKNFLEYFKFIKIILGVVLSILKMSHLDLDPEVPLQSPADALLSTSEDEDSEDEGEKQTKKHKSKVC